MKELGLDNPTGYYIEDLYDEHVYGIVTPDRRFKVDVNPSGSELLSCLISTENCNYLLQYFNFNVANFNKKSQISYL